MVEYKSMQLVGIRNKSGLNSVQLKGESKQRKQVNRGFSLKNLDVVLSYAVQEGEEN